MLPPPSMCRWLRLPRTEFKSRENIALDTINNSHKESVLLALAVNNQGRCFKKVVVQRGATCLGQAGAPARGTQCLAHSNQSERILVKAWDKQRPPVLWLCFSEKSRTHAVSRSGAPESPPPFGQKHATTSPTARSCSRTAPGAAVPLEGRDSVG